MDKQQVLNIIRKKGDFILNSGIHTNYFYDSCSLLKYPELCNHVTDVLKTLIDLQCIEIDYIISPAIGALPLGILLAQKLNKRFLFTEKDKNQRQKLQRFFIIEKDVKYLVFEDIFTTGKTCFQTARCVEASGGKIVGFVCLINRSNNENIISYAHIPLEKDSI